MKVAFHRSDCLPILVLAGCLLQPACFGKGLKFDAERLQQKCNLTGETEISLDDVRCIAKVAGLKEGKKCPFAIDELIDGRQRSVYDVRESCSGIGIRIDRTSGEIVGVDFGEAAAREPAE
jgi:hypothetical protein